MKESKKILFHNQIINKEVKRNLEKNKLMNFNNK